MVRPKNRYGSSDLARCSVSLLVVILIGAIACPLVVAQGIPTRRGRPPVQPAPKTKREPPPEPAEPEEPYPNRNYDELLVVEKLKGDTFDVRQILTEGNFAAGGQAMFNQFYSEYFLARWSQMKYIPKLPDYRQQLRREFWRAKGGEVYNRLNALVLDMMTKLAAGNFHPAVQVNAMLAIGELNDADQSDGGLAVPWPGALKMLIAAVENPRLSDAVRAAAMVGVLRHAAAGIRDNEARRSLAAAMLKLMAVDPPTGPAAPGRQWILAQAIETLGLLGSVGDDNAAFKAMLKAVAENQLSFSTRGIATKSLGHLNYADAAGIDPVAAADRLARFAADACAEELRLAQQTGRPVSPRRIKQRLDAVLAALSGEEGRSRKGIMSLAQENQKPLLEELRKSLQDASDLLDDKQNEGQNMGPPIQQLQSKLEAWLQKKPK